MKDGRTDNKISRREFVQRTLVGSAMVLGGVPLPGAEGKQEGAGKKRSAVDRVRLGKSGLVVPRLGMGTGSAGGQIQRDLGREDFKRLVLHAYERGVRFIDTSDRYGTHELVGHAIREVPRDDIIMQTKMPWKPLPAEPLKELDRYRRELGVDTIDILLIHCTRQKNWPAALERMRDALSEAKEKGIIRAHGVSCHGLPPLREVAGCEWVDVNLARINHRGHKMDGETGDWREHGNLPVAVAELKKIHAAGKGLIGMKIIGNGAFTDAEEREKSIRFVMSAPFVDSVVIGFKSTSEIDEAIERMDRALNS